MASRLHIATILLSVFSLLPPLSHGWGTDGHYIVCQIAQEQLSEAAADRVNELLPDHAKNNLSSLCSWADHVRFRYTWSSELHYINVPDDTCTYNYTRDCKDENGVLGRCVGGAITNYTNQLLTYRNSSDDGKYNLTQALLFLSHFMGDIHQPLHVGHTSDEGGNTIDVHWYTQSTVLHHVWDSSIVETAEDDFYSSDVVDYIEDLRQNITGKWSNQKSKWQNCSGNLIACPDIYASESISAACEWAYKDATNGSVLEDKYFYSRLPVVDLRLAQAGVRLAEILNLIFG
ncbi:endonuclease 2 isoform X2 [Phalaenopsis equestris]|uniref:endonuclease 2 isoform X2 n=1 Tax=Phalaenopsis equestris TaxID=78828 RepID=UPI0009E575B0|nr:endonuclease 2 isoform X2 [Phalaenopsis equestris]